MYFHLLKLHVDCLHDADFGDCTFGCYPATYCDCLLRYLGYAPGSKDACIFASDDSNILWMEV